MAFFCETGRNQDSRAYSGHIMDIIVWKTPTRIRAAAFSSERMIYASAYFFAFFLDFSSANHRPCISPIMRQIERNLGILWFKFIYARDPSDPRDPLGEGYDSFSFNAYV